MRLITLMLAVGLLSGCTTVQRTPIDKPTAAIGETAIVGAVAIRPLELLEDSRCPPVVQCVQTGTVRIQAEISASWDTDRVEMEMAEPVDAIGGIVTLVAVEPPARSGVRTEPGDYNFTFAFDETR